MLTRFFSKSKPVNFLIVMFFMAVVFFAHLILKEIPEFSVNELLFHLGMLVVLLFSMLLVDFVSGKNDLTKNNTYRIVLFALFVAMFPQTFLDPSVLAANVFILLAVRRIISMRTKKEIAKKVLDASLWITIAACFSFWAVLFFAVLFVAIFLYRTAGLKEFLIPFAGVATVMVLLNVYTIITKNAYFIPTTLFEPTDFDFSPYYALHLLIPIFSILAVFLWSLGYSLLIARKRRKQKRRILLYTSVVVSFLIILVSPQKNGSEFLFFALPFSVIVSNYLELPKDKYSKEVLLWALLAVPFGILFVS